MKKIRWNYAAAAFCLAGIASFSARADEWDRSEDGKHWMYYDYSGEALTDEWIEDQGKTYYVDSQGYMKTGWVTNKDDGKRYYMGEDGAMVFNAFTPDNRYVGPEGSVLERYDTYRKQVKSEIKKAAKTGSQKTKKTQNKSKKTADTAAAAEDPAQQVQQYYLLADLNQDGYRDIVVMEQTAGQAALQAASQGGVTEGSLLNISVWDPDTEKFQLAAEFDPAGEGGRSTLYLDPQGEGIWLEITDNEENLRMFQMEVDTSRFEGKWTFSTDLDDWGGLAYYQNGEEEDGEVWYAQLAEAKLRRGSVPLSGYRPVTDEDVAAQVDLVLTLDEAGMWEE